MNNNGERPLSSVFKEYFSFSNHRIFFFMILSIIPAIICQKFYMELNILQVKGAIYTIFFEWNYTKYGISTGYDFLIQPSVVFIILNLQLIGLKIIGWGFEDEEKENILSSFEKFLLPGIIVFYLIILAFSRVPLLAWILLLFIILFYLIPRTNSKIVIFFTLLLFNIILLRFYYRHFQFSILIAGQEDKILTSMAKIGFSWLYILPYNFFVFFPLIISVYFLDFRYPEKYISSFFDAVFHENMVAVFVGLLLNVMLSVVPLFIILFQPEIPIKIPENIFEEFIFSIHDKLSGSVYLNLSIFQIMSIVHFWIGSLVLWLTPFFVSLSQLETKFEANFDRKLRRIIQKMKEHIVMIGFGNLGRKVCRDLIERNVISLKNDTIEIFTPDLEVRKICNKLLIVDININLFDRVHTDPILQDVGVARSNPRSSAKKDYILIPAIVGDINSETTKDNSRMKKSKFIISAPSDYRATFTLSKFANSKNLNSIISVEDSAQKDYFSPKMTAHNTFFIYPAFQEGLALGRIISLYYIGLIENILQEGELQNNPRIVIAGEGKQINYLIETFWMEIERVGKMNLFLKNESNEDTNQESIGGKNKKEYKLPITVLTSNKEIIKRTKRKKRKKDKKLRQARELSKRSARMDESSSYLLVDVVCDVPYRLKTLGKIVERENPKIVVVTSKTIQDVSKIFYEWVITIERYCSADEEREKPVIIVGVLGDEYEEIKDILLYYTSMKPKSELKYPIQYLDSAVRVYDDSKEKIGGLAQSFIREKNPEYWKIGKFRKPFALHCCIEDSPGNLGDILGKLAGITFSDNNDNNLEGIEGLIDLHFCHFRSCSGVENYSFLANAELNKKSISSENIFCCLFQGDNIKFTPKKSINEYIKHLFYRQNRNQQEEKSVHELIKNSFGVGYIMDALSENIEESRLREICSCCDRRITCSISSYLRKIENLIENKEYYEQLEIDHKFPSGTVDQELKRFFINTEFRYMDSDRNQELPRAAISVCCRYSEITGSLSTAINNLLFKKATDISYDRLIADTTYLRSYECYKANLTYIEFYGNWVEPYRGSRELLKESGAIDLVFINVVTKKNEWIDYAKKLCKELNNIYKRETDEFREEDIYELWVDSNKNNIAVVRKGFKVSNEQTDGPIKVNCRKKECLIHNKLRLLRQKINI